MLRNFGIVAAAGALTLTPPVWAESAKLSAEVVKVEAAAKRVTLKAVMGHKTLRVAGNVPLDRFKPGDKVLIAVGQDGSETIIVELININEK